jgi:hypothetical protein
MARYATPITQYLDDAGNPLVGGKLKFYASGTENLQNTYNTEALTIANTNPVILDAGGRAGNVWMQDLDYKIRLYTSADVLVWEADPYTSTSTPSGFDVWSSTVTYGLNSIVEGSDNNFYVSIAATNLNQDPTTTPTYWTEFDVQRAWNTNETYAIGDVVRVSTGILYRSLTGSNLGNNPVGDQTNWSLAGTYSTVSGFMATTAVPNTAVAVTGVGFKPSLVNFQMTTGSSWEASSFGYYDGTVSQCVYRRNDGTTPFSGALNKIWFGANNAITLEASAVGTSMDADGFTYTTSSVTDTAANVIWTAYP